MDFAYTAYTEGKQLVKGKVSAISEEAATELLGYGGYKVVSLKAAIPLINKEKLLSRFSNVKLPEVVMFSRQLALLLESGTDIVTALDLLQGQITNKTLQKIVGEVSSDIRGGSSLSKALAKHPQAFSSMYSQAIAAGEQGGNLEIVLRQMADYMERGVVTQKKIKNAMTYPVIVVVAAIVVIAIMVTKVFPTFINMYSQLGVKLPKLMQIVMALTNWANHYGLVLLLALVIAVVAIILYIRTPAGKYRWHALMLRMPIFGRIIQLGELSRSCRTMALLIKVGLPLPEVMAATIRGITNKPIEESMSRVQQKLIRGEGLSKPMAAESLIMPLMTQMVGVGEETGNLENTLGTVAQSFEAEANDKTNAAVGMIQPVLTIILGLVVGFIVLTMFSGLYSVYGQLHV
ncbi:MAG TPA: type II secretion system F family protein [Dehalococcoidia bacterium]|nr:type II secretion system F family protein [Dehalococcoidia bacterium]